MVQVYLPTSPESLRIVGCEILDFVRRGAIELRFPFGQTVLPPFEIEVAGKKLFCQTEATVLERITSAV